MFQDWEASGCVVNNIATLTCIPIVFGNIINGLLLFVGAVAAILFGYAAFIFSRSGGDQKQIQEGKNILTYAIIGVILVLCSFGILYFIAYVTNTPCITSLTFDACANEEDRVMQ